MPLPVAHRPGEALHLTHYKRNEVKAMKYEKPEITVVGDATLLVRGGKMGFPLEPTTQQQRAVPDAELDE